MTTTTGNLSPVAGRASSPRIVPFDELPLGEGYIAYSARIRLSSLATCCARAELGRSMYHNAVAVRPPMANLAAPSRNSRRLMPPCTYLWKRLSSCGSKSLAFFLSIQLTPLNSVSSVRRLAQPALKINLSLQERPALKVIVGLGELFEGGFELYDPSTRSTAWPVDPGSGSSRARRVEGRRFARREHRDRGDCGIRGFRL